MDRPEKRPYQKNKNIAGGAGSGSPPAESIQGGICRHFAPPPQVKADGPGFSKTSETNEKGLKSFPTLNMTYYVDSTIKLLTGTHCDVLVFDSATKFLVDLPVVAFSVIFLLLPSVLVFKFQRFPFLE